MTIDTKKDKKESESGSERIVVTLLKFGPVQCCATVVVNRFHPMRLSMALRRQWRAEFAVSVTVRSAPNCADTCAIRPDATSATSRSRITVASKADISPCVVSSLPGRRRGSVEALVNSAISYISIPPLSGDLHRSPPTARSLHCPHGGQHSAGHMAEPLSVPSWCRSARGLTEPGSCVASNITQTFYDMR
jgi:hypothetical protein